MVVDPVATLLLAVEKDAAALAGARLHDVRPNARLAARLAEASGRAVPPGVVAFFSRFDGARLGPEARILTFEEGLVLRRDPRRAADFKGLWPIAERHGRLYALDTECPGTDGEWPVVELADRSVDRAGTTLLRFLQALLADMALEAGADDVTRARTLCARDPGL